MTARHATPPAGLRSVRIGPGELHVTTDPQEAIVTVLGSCVAACLRDPVARVGGMNHFMLPDGGTPGQADAGSWHTPATRLRYGSVAMSELLERVQRHGGRLERVEVKLFGASRLGRDGGSVGSANVRFAERYLHRIGLAPLARDLGGTSARRLVYHPASGRAFVLALRDVSADMAPLAGRA